MRPTTLTLDRPASGTGKPVDIGELREKTIQAAGITSSVIDVEATVDGTVWVAVFASVANGFHQLTGTYKSVRLKITSIGGGDVPVVTLAGINSRTK